MHFPNKILEKIRFIYFCHFSCVRHYALKLRPFTNFELLFSFLEFILILLFDLRVLGHVTS